MGSRVIESRKLERKQQQAANITDRDSKCRPSTAAMTSLRSSSSHRDDRSKINSSRFYGEYHGHRVEDLDTLYRVLRREPQSSLIWTAGDSSLDNKYWFNDEREAVPGSGYDEVLHPPRCNADVTYWLNYLLKERREEVAASVRKKMPSAAINTAVEATTLNSRTWKLQPQDAFLRDKLQPDDVLIVSVGGNDVAMAPAPCTICSVLFLMNCVPEVCLDRACSCGTVPSDDYCCGCGSSLGSCACSFPSCFGYMVHLFGTRVQKYVEKLTVKTRPEKILVLMIYFPDETPTPSWAGPALSCLGYNRTPQKLQTMIRRVYVEATSKILIDGSQVIPVPLFQVLGTFPSLTFFLSQLWYVCMTLWLTHLFFNFVVSVLDGTNPSDYVARVEPSSQGGKKMAEFLIDLIFDQKQTTQTSYGSTAQHSSFSHSGNRFGEPIESSYMAGRD